MSAGSFKLLFLALMGAGLPVANAMAGASLWGGQAMTTRSTPLIIAAKRLRSD